MKNILAAVMWLLAFGGAVINAQTSSRADCFQFESLPAEKRKRAEDLLLKALDSEALYTIVGAVKPMSSGFASFRLQVQLPRVELAEANKAVQELGAKKPEELRDEEKSRLSRSRTAIERRETLDKIEDMRAILEKWRCGDELEAHVLHFSRTFEGRRFLETFVFSRPRLRQMLAEKADIFSRWGVTVNSHPLDVLYAVEYDETSARNGGYGFLFGYPDYAVRFFVQSVDEEEFTGKFVERDFYSIPTFARETNSFVYAVPKNHAETESDRALKAKAASILASYKRRRAEYIGEGKRGAAEMLRDWFCPANNNCSPKNAKFD